MNNTNCIRDLVYLKMILVALGQNVFYRSLILLANLIFFLNRNSYCMYMRGCPNSTTTSANSTCEQWYHSGHAFDTCWTELAGGNRYWFEWQWFVWFVTWGKCTLSKHTTGHSSDCGEISEISLKMWWKPETVLLNRAFLSVMWGHQRLQRFFSLSTFSALKDVNHQNITKGIYLIFVHILSAH